MSEHKQKMILTILENNQKYSKLKEKLRQYPFHLIETPNGYEGFDLAKKEAPDLILASTQLSDIDGFDLCWMIRQTPELMAVPYVLISETNNPEERINAYRSGVDAFLYSDVSVREIYTIVETTIRRIQQIKKIPENIDKSLQGKIPQFTVVEILQMLHISKKSGTLTLFNQKLEGKIGFWDGKIIWAELDDYKGEQAVKEIVFWEKGIFTFENDLIHPVMNIESPTMQLILNCCQELDEKVNKD